MKRPTAISEVKDKAGQSSHVNHVEHVARTNSELVNLLGKHLEFCRLKTNPAIAEEAMLKFQQANAGDKPSAWYETYQKDKNAYKRTM